MSVFHGSRHPKMTFTVAPSCTVTVLICVTPAAIPCLLRCLGGRGVPGTGFPGDQVGAFSGGGAGCGKGGERGRRGRGVTGDQLGSSDGAGKEVEDGSEDVGAA